MRPLNLNEKRLLIVLGLLIFLGGNFFGIRWFVQKQRELALKEADLKGNKAEALVILQSKDRWEKRAKWIQDHQPVFTDEGSDQAAVLDGVLKPAKAAGMEVLEQNLGGVSDTASGKRVDVSFKMKGSMQAICQWLAELEKPESFYAIYSLDLKSDQDQKSMICTIQVCRFFKVKTP